MCCHLYSNSSSILVATTLRRNSGDKFTLGEVILGLQNAKGF